MLHEVSRTTIQLTKYEDIDIVWHNNVLTVRCDSGLHLFEFSYNLNCLDKKIDFFESKVVTSRASPATELFSKTGIKQGIRNMELSQMVLDPSLWPHNKHLMEVAIIVAFEWSPVDFIGNNESVLATVNSGGNIDLYAQGRHQWSKLENLSLKLKQEMITVMPHLYPYTSKIDKKNFKLVKEVAYAFETSSICWSPVLNEDKSCFFVTSQKNGHILFWLIKYENKDVDVKLLHHISENVDEIVTMKWIVPSVNQFILVTSNVLGQINAYQCQLVNDVLEVSSAHPLWAHKDKMIAQYIQYESSNEHIVFVCNKHRHLLLLMIDKHCKVVYQSVTNVNDQKITSVVKNNNSFYTSTVNLKLYKVNYVVENEALQVHLVPVEMKPISSVFELYSFAFSCNDIILALALLDRTILYRKLPLKLDIVLYTDESRDLIATIINNPTKTLTDIWDVIETLRCRILKSKVLPNLDYNKLFTDSQTDIFKGKVYLILLKFYNNLEITIQNGSRGLLPEISIDIIKSHITACHAVKLIKEICKTQVNEMTGRAGDKFDLQCLHMARMYLIEFCNKNKLNDLLPSDIVNVLQKVKDPQYTCQWCDNILNGFTCKDNHINSFCSLTFTPIESNEYLICRSCGAIARFEIYLDKPKCVFCDLYLSNCWLPL